MNRNLLGIQIGEENALELHETAWTNSCTSNGIVRVRSRSKRVTEELEIGSIARSQITKMLWNAMQSLDLPQVAKGWPGSMSGWEC